MPLSKSTADRLATVGDRMGWIDSATSLNLPRGWNILFCLARLDRGALEQLIQQGFIHPELTLREAKALVAEFTGKQAAAGQPKANVRERLRRFEEFVQDTLHGWTALDRELARATLSQLTEQIGQPSSLASGSDLYPKTTRRSSDALVLSSAASQADHSNSLHNLRKQVPFFGAPSRCCPCAPARNFPFQLRPADR